LRDAWYALGNRRKEGAIVNERKRSAIFELFSRSETLRKLESDSFPSAGECGEFNRRFMGDWGARIKDDIASPRLWPVKALRDAFGAEPAVFRELCRFKWAFNIKPDLVLIAPGAKPICVEAKLESGEGSYPTNNEECAIFDALFQGDERRVRQVDLQKFMFGTLLGVDCQPVVVGRTPWGQDSSIPFLSWADLFARLDFSASLPFVARLAAENVVVQDRVTDAELPPDDM
jgi:hypothetical protein